MVLLILGCFSICWMPYFVVIIIIQLDDSIQSTLVYELAFRMALANSCMNPLIYAWKNSNFRKIFWCLLRCKSPNSVYFKRSFITNYIPRSKKSSTENTLCNGHQNYSVAEIVEIEGAQKMQTIKNANNQMPSFDTSNRDVKKTNCVVPTCPI